MIWYWDFFYGCIRTLIEMCFFMFRRSRTKVRKKTKYTILDNMDEQEKMELRPKYSKCLIFHSTHFKHFLCLVTLPWSTRSVPISDIKHRSTEHNSSLMMSESELDSDQDTIFSRDRPVRSRNRTNAQAARNGNTFGWAGTHETGVVIGQHEWNPLLRLWQGCTARVLECHSVCLFLVSSSIQILVSTRCVLSMTFIGRLSTREMWKSKGRRILELGIPGFWGLTVALSLHTYRLFEWFDTKDEGALCEEHSEVLWPHILLQITRLVNVHTTIHYAY